MTNINSIFRAGFVRRWHSNPDLCHTADRIDGHSARVARIMDRDGWPELLTWINETAELPGVDMKEIGIC